MKNRRDDVYKKNIKDKLFDSNSQVNKYVSNNSTDEDNYSDEINVFFDPWDSDVELDKKNKSNIKNKNDESDDEYTESSNENDDEYTESSDENESDDEYTESSNESDNVDNDNVNNESSDENDIENDTDDISTNSLESIDISIDSDGSLPDHDDEDDVIYPFKIVLHNHLKSVEFVRNQGDQYDISGDLDINKGTLRLSSASGNKNKLITICIYNPLIVYSNTTNPIKFGLVFPDEFVSNGNELLINRYVHKTVLISTNDGNNMQYSFNSTNASSYIRYSDWDGNGAEMFSISRLLDINELAQFLHYIADTNNDTDDIIINIIASSNEQLSFSAYNNDESNVIISMHMGTYGIHKKKYSGESIKIKLQFLDLYEIISDNTMLLCNMKIMVYVMKDMPFVMKCKINNSDLSIAIIQEN